jgi:hypothetical protein
MMIAYDPVASFVMLHETTDIDKHKGHCEGRNIYFEKKREKQSQSLNDMFYRMTYVRFVKNRIGSGMMPLVKFP